MREIGIGAIIVKVFKCSEDSEVKKVWGNMEEIDDVLMIALKCLRI